MVNRRIIYKTLEMVNFSLFIMFSVELVWFFVVYRIILLENCVSNIDISSMNVNSSMNLTFTELENAPSVLMKAISRYDRSHTFRGHFTQYPENIFFVVFHNALQSCIDLFKYWRRKTSIIFIDKYYGFEENVLKNYMLKHQIISEVLTVEHNSDLMKILQKSSTQANFIVICDQHNSKKIISMANSLDFFITDSTWTIVGDQPLITDLSIVISSRTQVTLIKPMDSKCQVKCSHEDSNHAINVFDVFYNDKIMKIDMVKFASWTLKKQLILLEDFEPEDKIKKLEGRKIRTIVFQHPPYSYISMDENNGLRLKGLSIEVMSILLQHFKITYEIQKIDENWGNYVNGAYTGASGYLNRRQADLSLNMFTMTNQRLGGIQYSGIIGKVDLSLAYNRPDAAIPPTNYVLPFDVWVWTLIILSFMTIVLLFAIVMMLSPGWKEGDVPTVRTHTTLFRLLTGTFFEEVLEDPPGIPARVLYASLLIATTLIFIMYTSVFTSFLAYRDLKLPIQNLRDVVRNKDYTPLSLKNLMQVETFKRAKSGVYRDLWQKMLTIGDVCIADNYMAAVSTMYSGRYVFTADGASIIAAIDNNCSVELIRTAHMREYAYVVSRMDFPFSRIFYTGLTRLIEGGVMRKIWKIHMLDSRPPCPIDDQSETFGLDQVSGVFFILGCGIVMALIGLAIEKSIYKRKK